MIDYEYHSVADLYPEMSRDNFEALKKDTERNREIITTEIRRLTVSGERQPCAVCGKYREITHCHHLWSVSDMANFCIEHDIHHLALPIHIAWLCPNHHALWHVVNSKKPMSEKLKAIKEFDIKDLDVFTELERSFPQAELTKRLKIYRHGGFEAILDYLAETLDSDKSA